MRLDSTHLLYVVGNLQESSDDVCLLIVTLMKSALPWSVGWTSDSLLMNRIWHKWWFLPQRLDCRRCRHLCLVLSLRPLALGEARCLLWESSVQRPTVVNSEYLLRLLPAEWAERASSGLPTAAESETLQGSGWPWTHEKSSARSTQLSHSQISDP